MTPVVSVWFLEGLQYVQKLSMPQNLYIHYPCPRLKHSFPPPRSTSHQLTCCSINIKPENRLFLDSSPDPGRHHWEALALPLVSPFFDVDNGVCLILAKLYAKAASDMPTAPNKPLYGEILEPSMPDIPILGWIPLLCALCSQSPWGHLLPPLSP